MANPVRVGDLCTVLEKEFDVDRDTCEREVLSLLTQALAEGMIKVERRSAAAGERAA
jgi:Coenzyme PQQ synthesis protein D (PqqD)